MKIRLLLFFILICIQSSFSETGYVCELDLNCDGIKDKIHSGPQALFGNAGGVFAVTIANTNGTAAQTYLIEGNPNNFVYEKTSDNTGRLWTFWRTGPGEGVIYMRTFYGNKMKESRISVDVEMKEALLEKIYASGKILKMNIVKNYTPQAGLPWGK